MNKIKERVVYEKNGKRNIFNINQKFIIPLYQREFAWEQEEIEQLILDIASIKANVDEIYYLGSLILHYRENNGEYEVIDGQQRLTALFLLLKGLKIDIPTMIEFECRDKANYTLKNIDYLEDENKKIKIENLDENIKTGINIIHEIINKNDFNQEKFIKKLSHVKIYTIEVPKRTDLNKYFEIMNVRGEQLEQQDILKARLMKSLPFEDVEVRENFSLIWDACSDMTGYVQMHLKKELREKIFGLDWNNFYLTKFYELKGKGKKEIKQNKVNCSITDIINNKVELIDIEEDMEVYDKRIRFKSIISFPYFLLHVLRVFVSENTLKQFEKLLDDKNLVETFDFAINQECSDENERREFSEDFIVFLLKSRFLFDKYIIKREYYVDKKEREGWSLKELHSYGQGGKKKPVYDSSKFGRTSKCEEIEKIQAALRVSYTSPKIMHWITESLKWIIKGYDTKDIQNLNVKLENYARQEIKKYIVDMNEKGEDPFKQGTNTPHILFNYLDYIIWKNDKDTYRDFKFEFRNSVEHWFPQNPLNESFIHKKIEWKDINSFGNLCLVPSNINSRFSNLMPESKKDSFSGEVCKGSIKLRIMGGMVPNIRKAKHSWTIQWIEGECKKHEEKMKRYLLDDINF